MAAAAAAAGGRRGGGGGRPAAAFPSTGWGPSSLRRLSSTRPAEFVQLLNVLAEAPLDRLADGDIEKLSACFDVPRYLAAATGAGGDGGCGRVAPPPR